MIVEYEDVNKIAKSEHDRSVRIGCGAESFGAEWF
jgi:hypothetical protein